MVDRSRQTSTPTGWVAPMKATIGPLPTGEGWAHELKWDGMRLVARCRVEAGSSTLTLWSANGRDVTSSFPELADLPQRIGVPAVLDGEAVVFDGDGPSFGRLQNRMHVDQPGNRLVAEHPVVFVVFDLLELDGRSLIDLPYRTRRRLLRELVDDGPTCRVPPEVEGDGSGLLDLARQRSLEGVVSKRLDSHYVPGARSRDWVKVKVRQHQELVVGGWLPGRGALAGTIGSLLVGYRASAHEDSAHEDSAHEDSAHEDSALHYAGAVGSGLSDRHRALLRQRLTERATCPFESVPPLGRPPIWVEPDVVVEVAYGSWTAEGLLRHPVYIGLRTDKDAADVGRELPWRGPDVE